jgi:manganese transport protein
MSIEKIQNDLSLADVHGSVDASAKKNWWRKILAFFGPAYLVSVGYMDPGNWATDLEGGSKFGYQLLWILLMSNLMAVVLQTLCARLGIVYKRDLAQANRDTYPMLVNIPLYILAEIAIAACELAEVLGMAIGLKLLFGIPLIWAVLITVVDTFLLLLLQRYGIRKIEAFILSLVAIIFACFAVQLFLVKPELGAVAKGFVPTPLNKEALYIAIGIIGATVMPHNLYLHSALVQTRKTGDTIPQIKKTLRYNFWDTAIALNLALFVNAAILILSATTFFNNNLHSVNSIEQAHELLAPLVGSNLAPTLFAIALIAAGQSSTITGTLAGQIIMEGYLHIRINPWVRRLVTRLVAVVPAVVVILISGEDQVTSLLVFSQVILSIQLPFAVIPLIIFVSDKSKMGGFAIKWPIRILSIVIAGIILYLNCKLIFGKAAELLAGDSSTSIKFLVVLGLILFVLLLLAATFLPYLRKVKHAASIHKQQLIILDEQVNSYSKIALALDFSTADQSVINNALKQGGKNAHYTLIHILESAPAKILGDNIGDSERTSDEQQLLSYVALLQQKGYNAKAQLGYRNRVQELARLANESEADLLVIGAHGHRGLTDFIYGETVNEVRHLVKMPVLVVK